MTAKEFLTEMFDTGKLPPRFDQNDEFLAGLLEKYAEAKTQVVKIDDVHEEVRKLAVAWGEAYHLGMIETIQLGTQIQGVFNKINYGKGN